MADIQKLNTLGRARGTQAKYGGAQIINVTYGHQGSGKLYSYYGTNKRVGDIVTPEVTHPKSGKTYRTLAVVRSTHNAGEGTDTVDYLQQRKAGANGQNINQPKNLKGIGKTDQKSLPGYYEGWDKDAKIRKENKLNAIYNAPPLQRISIMRDSTIKKGV